MTYLTTYPRITRYDGTLRSTFLIWLGKLTARRLATVQAEATVARRKLYELAHVNRDAQASYVWVCDQSAQLAATDVMIRDDLAWFTHLHKLGAGEIYAATLESYVHEGQW